MNISEHKLNRDVALDISSTSDIAEIRVFTDLSIPSSDWIEIEAACEHTIFQTHAWLAAWQEHIGSKAGIRPQIIIGYGATGTIRFLLPLAIRSIGPLRILCYLGCEEASYQMGLYAPGFSRSLTPARISQLAQQIKALLPAFDVIRFKRQPYEWQGIYNPLANFPHKTAPSNGYAISLNADYQTLYAATRSWKSRSKILRREHKLAEHGGITYNRCITDTETSRVLDIMFAQKEKRFCEQGITNFLKRPGVGDFYRSLCLESKNDKTHTLGLHYYKCGSQVLAIVLSAPYRNTEYGLINSITDGPLRHYSPGLHLLHRDIERLCTGETSVYDLGVGANNYKNLWTDKEYPLFDTIIPTTVMGYIYSFGSRCFLRAKRDIKNSRILWPTFLKCRARLFSFWKPDKCPSVNETL